MLVRGRGSAMPVRLWASASRASLERQIKAMNAMGVTVDCQLSRTVSVEEGMLSTSSSSLFST